jgi:protein-S-isoprenylcysteine O-methyltransferase Ste14
MVHVRPLIVAWPEGLAFWGLLVWAYWLEGRQLQRKKQSAAGHDGVDRYSGLVISIGSFCLQALGFAMSFYEPTNMPDAWVVPAFYIGLIVIVSGMLLRMHCWRVLGAFFTHTVTIASDHRVVDGGAYRWVRHPSYLGALLTFLGLGLALGNLASLALLVLGSWAIYIYRIEVEERALESALGANYTHFKQSRKRLIPFVY